jgi:hypothetical protein
MEITNIETRKLSFINILSESFGDLFNNFGKIFLIFTPLLVLTVLTGNIFLGIIFSILNLLMTNFTSIALMKYLQRKKDTGEELKLSELVDSIQNNLYKYTKLSVYVLLQTILAAAMLTVMTFTLLFSIKYFIASSDIKSFMLLALATTISYYAFVNAFKIYIKIAFLYQIVADKKYNNASDYLKESNEFCENHEDAVRYAVIAMCLFIPLVIVTIVTAMPILAGLSILMLLGIFSPVIAAINLIFGSFTMIVFQNIYNRCKV